MDKAGYLGYGMLTWQAGIPQLRPAVAMDQSALVSSSVAPNNSLGGVHYHIQEDPPKSTSAVT